MMDDRNDTQTRRADAQHLPLVTEAEETREDAPLFAEAKFPIGLPVRHRKFGFHGVIFDVDPEFDNTEEWYQSIPEEVRPRKDQPFYHLFAVNPQDESPYIAYVSEQNLEPSADDEGPFHPAVAEYFDGMEEGRFVLRLALN
ncbi:heat shock protein HspQ [Marivibrio halodurans]|nr:heat shock protein HspQ [Marivibrio halodurans]